MILKLFSKQKKLFCLGYDLADIEATFILIPMPLEILVKFDVDGYD